MNTIKRLRALAGLREATQIMATDDSARQHDVAQARELKVARFIAIAFKRVGLVPADDGVFYDEDNEREAVVTLENDWVDLNAFMRLQTSGLASGYRLSAVNNQITVIFTVDSAIEAALGILPG